MDGTGAEDAPKILVVDDEPSVRQVLKRALRPLGRTVLCADCFEVGSRMFRAEDIDVAVVDKNLPDGSGIDLVRELRQEKPEVETLLITGFGSLDSALDAIHAGVYDYISKPFDVQHIKKRVQGALSAVEKRRQHGLRLQTVYRMEALGRLSASVGHEINNPLAYVLGNVDFVSDRLRGLVGQLPSETIGDLLEATREIFIGADRIRSIVRDLTVLARREQEDSAGPVEINRTVEAAVKVVSNQLRHNATLTVDVGAPPTVKGAELRLFQVMINLLVNANQALAEARKDNRVQVRTGVDGEGWATIEVEDNGEGIEPAIIDQIFDRFFTTKELGSGTGLGLSISKRYVESMGGRIAVRSTPGAGSTFTIHLPPAALIDRHEIKAPARPAPAAVSGRAAVLIVDDDDLVLKCFTRMLRKHDVHTCLSATDALKLLQGGARFDLILCDVMMPGMDGIDMHGALGESLPDVARQIVFMSGGAFTSRAETFVSSVGNRFVDKPVAPQDLQRLIRESLDKKRD